MSKIINELFFNFNSFKEIAISDKDTRDHFMFFKEHLSEIDYLQNPFSAFYLRVLGVIRIIFGLFLASNIASIYFLFTIIGIPIFILMIGIYNFLISYFALHIKFKLNYF